MYHDNEYASARATPVYDKAYFIARFSAIPDNKWCVDAFDDGAGRHCALGHLMKPGAHTWINEESLALGALFRPDNPEGGAHRLATVNDDPIGAYAGDGYGQTPKARVLHALSLLPDPVTTDIRAKVGIEEVRVVERSTPKLNWSYMEPTNAFDAESTFATSKLIVGPSFWKIPQLQP